jgi:hypothetical protein
MADSILNALEDYTRAIEIIMLRLKENQLLEAVKVRSL